MNGSENMSPDYYIRLASALSTQKLELIETIFWVLSHGDHTELREACKDELSKRRGPAVLTRKEAV